jgi:Do/DeqQ family serine protease
MRCPWSRAGIGRRVCSAALMLALVLTHTGAVAALPSGVGGQPLPTLAPMLKLVTPAVVNIAVRGSVAVRESPMLRDPFFRHFFNVPQRERRKPTSSLGSGVIVDAKAGLVVTNHHVIEDAEQILVTLRDGRTVSAEVVGTDAETDVALIRIPSNNLTAVTLADSDKVQVGDFVVAIGNPFGLGQTVTSGIVSALGRSGLGIEGYEDFIQTDASINVGNSGGALVNLRGELVGINTAILAPGGGSVGIGFAIPTNMVQRVTEQLVEFGQLRRGLLGIEAQDLTPELAEAFGLDESRGAVVVAIQNGSAASDAGLQPGDVVLEVNGTRTLSSAQVRNVVGLLRVGELVRMAVLRGSQRLMMAAKLREPAVVLLPGQEIHPALAGSAFAEIPATDVRYGRMQGVVVADVQVGSPAARRGLQPGDLVIAANRVLVGDLDAFASAASARRSLMLNLLRGNERMMLLVR